MNFNSWSFDIGKFSINMDRPILLLIIIPVLILGIVPFFRLHKNRRRASKHIIPFIIHLLLISLLATMITGIRIVETDTAPTNTNIIVVADMSESNAVMKEEMNKYIQSLAEQADENTKIGVVVFSGGQIYTTELGAETDNYIDFDEELFDASATDIEAALRYAQTLFPGGRQNKRVVLLSDGRQTYGNAWSAARNLLNDNIRLDAVYFDVSASDNSEVQLISLTTLNENVKNGVNVEMELTLKSTVQTTGKVEVYDGETVVFERDININAGGNSYRFEYLPAETGIHAVYAVITTDDDSIDQNNTLYSWFNVKGIAQILMVQGDDRQTVRVAPLIEGENYTVTVISDSDFPSTMQELLAYDEVVLMNADFNKMGNNAPALLKRYVEEVGRGLLVTCGDNTYDYNNEAYKNSPIEEILPVHLEIDDTKETIAIVLVVDLSSSMKQQMGSTGLTRFDVVKEGAKRCVDALTENDYIGVIVFDQNSKIAVPMTSITEKEWIKSEIDKRFDEYINTSYGTSYTAGLREASSMLSEFDANIKQVVFLSDGAPNDKGSGYDGIISRMASTGIVTSTVVIGSDDNAADELERLSRLGKGSFTRIRNDQGTQLPDVLFTIAESVKGDYLNDRVVQPEKLNESSVLRGVDDLDKLGGYYGTTIKDGASLIISVEDLRPIYAEWKYGLGKVAVFMSDFGSRWTDALFDDSDEISNTRLVQNVFTAALNNIVGSSGMTHSTERSGIYTRLTVNTYRNVRQGEIVIATVTTPDGEIYEYELNKVAAKKYRATIETPDEDATYKITVKIQEERGEKPLQDIIDLATVGYYPEEYDIFAEGGRELLSDVSASAGGSVMESGEDFYNIEKEDIVEYRHDLQTVVAIIALLLFLLDIVFRNFTISFRKEKEEMTEEERRASMAGR